MSCVADRVPGHVRRAVPKPTERQHLENQINAAFIFARAEFVNVHPSRFIAGSRLRRPPELRGRAAYQRKCARELDRFSMFGSRPQRISSGQNVRVEAEALVSWWFGEADRCSWQKACDLGFRGNLGEWERLL